MKDDFDLQRRLLALGLITVATYLQDTVKGAKQSLWPFGTLFVSIMRFANLGNQYYVWKRTQQGKRVWPIVSIASLVLAFAPQILRLWRRTRPHDNKDT
jgi:hypothetical protein